MAIEKSIADLRRDYRLETLDEADLSLSAPAQFDKWWNQAREADIDEVNAMTLATAGADGWPDARTVLLKSFDEEGFIFFTNYQSAKARQLDESGKASLVLFWKELERQVRISGTVEKIAAADSDLYFHSRPRGSQLGAWASPQSEVIPGREVLEKSLADVQDRFLREALIRPPFWGGYRVRPVWIEFWQGRSNRLHDRFRYTRLGSEWLIERLAP